MLQEITQILKSKDTSDYNLGWEVVNQGYLTNEEYLELLDGLKKAGDSLNLNNTPITSLPDGLKVGGNLNLYNTLLSKKYSKDQIKQMIEDRGGYVKGGIYF